ncbi:hypothetical protein TWF225_010033 [Orbilia oligospora]|nr:hypothetical protein TWF225_010033 [Orbilia oligospora]KAF3243323.1 hypothetical protein TWF128_010293 [Orbilia oligospora]KAF3266785.1 hypothetical protein TWF217_000879 [Orbilia oligospora]
MMRSRQQTVRKRANATAQIEETASLEDPYAQQAHPGPSTTTPTPSVSDSESNASGTTMDKDPEYSGFENLPAIPPNIVDFRRGDRYFIIESSILPGYITRIQVPLEIHYRVRMALMLFALLMQVWGFCFALGYGLNYVGITLFGLVSVLYIALRAFTKQEDTCGCACGCA